MELHQLRYFLAIVKTGNFSRAAESCHVSQPSLSQQILKLEAELTEKLFVRSRREVRLTPAGDLFRQRAENILHEVHEAKREVRDAAGIPRGEVHLAALPTIAPYLLPKILRAFSRRCPLVELIVHEESTDRALHGLGNRELDLALVSLPISDGRTEIRRLFREELLLALPRGHALARKRALNATDLEPENFIFMSDTHCLGAQTLQFCYAQGFSPRVSCRSAQIETVHALVAAGVGVSIVPAMARRGSRSGGVVYRSLGKARPTREIALIWNRKRQLSRAGRDLRDYLLAETRKTSR
ncbi:MAG TPA: LysR family transcriptional regulator [Chthoniobacterales bacterium]